MMEEIDRFQVPNAVQEAEMQAEMQPLVSQHPDKRLLGLVFIFPDIVVFHFKQDWLASPVILLRDKSFPPPVKRDVG